MDTTIRQLFDADLRESEKIRMRRDLETYRAYLAGHCDEDCPSPDEQDYSPLHRHWTAWYEHNRGNIVALNMILDGEFNRQMWAELALTVVEDFDADELERRES